MKTQNPNARRRRNPVLRRRAGDNSDTANFGRRARDEPGAAEDPSFFGRREYDNPGTEGPPSFGRRGPENPGVYSNDPLKYHRDCYEAGFKHAARWALRFCAAKRRIMPGWLATIVVEEIDQSSKGVPTDAFGFGNQRSRAKWRKDYLDVRDTGICSEFQHYLTVLWQREYEQTSAWHQDLQQEYPLLADVAAGRKVSKTEMIKRLARKYSLTTKAIEKILYGPAAEGIIVRHKAPTRQAQK